MNASRDNMRMIDSSIDTLTRRMKKCNEDVDNALGTVQKRVQWPICLLRVHWRTHEGIE
jgi:hypothetical protein